MSAKVKAKDLLAKDEIAALTAKSDLWGAWAIGSTWAIIAGALFVAARWPHPLTFLFAVIVIGGRQLCLAILMHEGAHRTLFASRWANDVLTDWLCARPTWNRLEKYREHHLRHHSRTRTAEDPDRALADPFPVSRGSLVRKMLRDVVGLSGLKRVVGLAMMDAGILAYSLAGEVERLPQGGRSRLDALATGARNMASFLFSNLVLFALCAALGHAWVFSAWVVAYLTTFGLFLRIRSFAEHACTEKSSDPLTNTRTTEANLLARVLVAPVHVNFHVEHHLLAAVPYYRLAKMHKLLHQRGALPKPTPGYFAVMREITNSAAS
jgi:fatty acid desaturase